MDRDPELSPLVRQLVNLMGRRADDPDLVAFVTGTLGQKVPATTTDGNHTKNLVARKHGLELAFTHDVKNEKYPLVPKTKTAFAPYLPLAWLKPRFPEPPFGVTAGLPPEELTRRLGAEPVVRVAGPVWRRVLDPVRDVVLQVDAREVTIGVDEARELSSRHGVPSGPVVGLFVAWAVQRGLIDESRLAPRAELVAAVRRRERRGSDLVAAAMPRGLWDAHLRDEPGLRDFAYGWFHNIGGSFIRDDLVGVFGSRAGPYGHAEPALDADDWSAVDRAAPALDARFAAWVR